MSFPSAHGLTRSGIVAGLDIFSVSISSAGGGAGDDRIDVSTLAQAAGSSRLFIDRPLKPAAAAGEDADYTVTVEYYGEPLTANSNGSIGVGALSGIGTVTESSITFQTNDVIRSSATIAVKETA
jgi:hypothetical protein